MVHLKPSLFFLKYRTPFLLNNKSGNSRERIQFIAFALFYFNGRKVVCNLRWALTSVTRLGKNLTLGLTLNYFWKHIEGLFCLWQNFQLTLVKKFMNVWTGPLRLNLLAPGNGHVTYLSHFHEPVPKNSL